MFYLIGGRGGGGGLNYTCPYPLRVQACPPQDQKLSPQGGYLAQYLLFMLHGIEYKV